MSENKNIKISDLVLNSGQIEGLPKNPRFIRNERFESLKKSIKDAPEMLDYRRLAVYPFNGKYVILCGNMRFRACKPSDFVCVGAVTKRNILSATANTKAIERLFVPDNQLAMYRAKMGQPAE